MERDLRRFPRIPSRHSVLVHRLGPSEIEGLVPTQTVGLGGCSFLADESFGLDQPLRLLLTIDGTVVEATARVASEQRSADGRTVIGVEFLEMSDRHRAVLAGLLGDDEEVRAG